MCRLLIYSTATVEQAHGQRFEGVLGSTVPAGFRDPLIDAMSVMSDGPKATEGLRLGLIQNGKDRY